MSRVAVAIVITVLALIAGPAAMAQESGGEFVERAEQGFIDAINASRAEADRAPLVLNESLRNDVARPWTVVMADANDLHHNPDYSSQYNGEWVRMGENVGVSRGGTDVDAIVASLHRAFMDSTGHRRNILGAYNQVGIGVVQRGSTLWVTVNFLEGPIAGETAEEPAAEPTQEEFASEEAPQEPGPYHRRPRARRAG